MVCRGRSREKRPALAFLQASQQAAAAHRKREV
jgi:hypothetical protein